ncbi:MAG: SpoIIE family protein phosphatase [Bacteroidales bacterium]|nr:SpoIIE family protein phosphatase [Bacteroidales bacterium]
MNNKTVQSGIMRVAAFGAAVMVIGLILYYIFQYRQNQAVQRYAKQDKEMLINTVLGVTLRQYSNIVHDNSAWDECYQAMVDDNHQWLNDNIGYMVDGYKSAGVVMLDTLGNIKYENRAAGMEEFAFWPFANQNIHNLFTKELFPHFYAKFGDRVFIYFGAGLVPAAQINSRNARIRGYLLMVKEISDEVRNDFASALGGMKMNVVVSEQELHKVAEELDPMIVTNRDMHDYNDKHVAYMYFAYDDMLSEQTRNFIPIFILVSILCLGILAAILFYVKQKVTKPLIKIDASFKSGTTDQIITLKSEANEFGIISKMMEDFFQQKDNLKELNSELQKQKEEIMLQNETLHQQKEEILVQSENVSMLNEELRTINDDLAAQKVLLELRNHEITAANQQLTSGINYASRLQTAMVQAVAPNYNIFRNYFVIYQPKDIVGGDFYFAKKVNNYIIAAMGDCTGHGVPGAILASMGLSFLNELINDQKEHEIMPGTILDALRTKVTSALGLDQDGQLRNDGMDIALLIYNEKTRLGYYSGAQRPMVIVRNGEVQTIKGDSMPIGHFILDKKFSNVMVQLQPNDKIYLYSDGCTDQNGGPNNRKIMSKYFKEKILEYSTMEFVHQKVALEKFIFDWKGSKPQTDDITLLAFEI